MARLGLATPRLSTVGFLEGIKFNRDLEAQAARLQTERLNQQLLQQNVSFGAQTLPTRVLREQIQTDTAGTALEGAIIETGLEREFGAGDRALRQGQLAAQTAESLGRAQERGINIQQQQKFGDALIESDLATAQARRGELRAATAARQLGTALDVQYAPLERQAGLQATAASIYGKQQQIRAGQVSTQAEIVNLQNRYNAAVAANDTVEAERLLKAINAARAPSKATGISGGLLGGAPSGITLKPVPRL